MLIRVVVSNFLSFYQETEFNMLAGVFKTHKHHVYKIGKINVLKAAALYGANGAGKSNLIKGIHLLSTLVKSGTIEQSVNKYKFKLSKDGFEKPVSLEMEFSIGKKIYAYGIKMNHLSVQEEWLYESGIEKDDKLIFERKQTKSGKSNIKVSPTFLKVQRNKLLIKLLEEDLLKNDELLIGKSSILKMKEVVDARRWFEEKLLIIFPDFKYGALTEAIHANEGFRTFANEMLVSFDTGISSLVIESTPFDQFFGDDEDGLKVELKNMLDNGESPHFPMEGESDIVVARENGKDVVKRTIASHLSQVGNPVMFELDEESDGTKRLLDFIPAFQILLNNDVTFIIDEIDQSLHPALLQKLVQKIMSDPLTKGQLIFSTHESSLLDLEVFRQDEIWFAEKNKDTGSTQLYSLSEFKPRYDLDIRKGYLKGRFGAIPFLAHLDDLKWHLRDA